MSPGMVRPTAHYQQIQGRAAEIARSLGSRIGGAEYLFLGMLHDCGWPVVVLTDLVDLDRAEMAVLAIIEGPGYAPPSSASFKLPVPDGFVQRYGVKTAVEMGDSHVGLEPALLAIIRDRESVPPRALAGLADLDALEAAVLAVKNAPVGPSANAVFLPEGQHMDGPLREAIIRALPEGTTFGFNFDSGGRAWMCVFKPGDTIDPAVSRDVLNTALTSLDRPTAEG